MVISMLKIRRPLGRLIFNMGIAIPGKTVFLIETAPWEPISVKFQSGFIILIQENAFENVFSQNGDHFVQGEMYNLKSATEIFPSCCGCILSSEQCAYWIFAVRFVEGFALLSSLMVIIPGRFCE